MKRIKRAEHNIFKLTKRKDADHACDEKLFFDQKSSNTNITSSIKDINQSTDSELIKVAREGTGEGKKVSWSKSDNAGSVTFDGDIAEKMDINLEKH